MGALTQVIKDPARRRMIVDDGVSLLEKEVASKKGVSGMAVKAGFKIVKSVKPGIIPQAFNNLLDDFCARIDPFYDDFKASGSTDLRVFFSDRSDRIAAELLAITDARAEHNHHRTLRKAYFKLRPQAEKHVTAAIPGVADLVARHVD